MIKIIHTITTAQRMKSTSKMKSIPKMKTAPKMKMTPCQVKNDDEIKIKKIKPEFTGG